MKNLIHFKVWSFLTNKYVAVATWILIAQLAAKLSKDAYLCYFSFRRWDPYIQQTPSTTSNDVYNAVITGPMDSSLHSPRTHLVVHMLWCMENEMFTFNNYLSVMSAVKVLRPSKIIFHQHHKPRTDPTGYNDWFELIQKDVFFFNVIDDVNGSFCHTTDIRLRDILLTLMIKGGVYIPLSVVLTHTSNISDWYQGGSELWDESGHNNSAIFATKVQNFQLKTKHFNCLSVSSNTLESVEHSKRTNCLNISFQIHHRDVITSNNPLDKLCRWIAYDKHAAIFLKKETTQVIPRIAHYIFSKRLTFLDCFSILSAIHVAKFDRVYIHIDSQDLGDSSCLSETSFVGNDNITVLYSPYVKKLYHCQLAEGNAKILHAGFILLRHGGVYVGDHVMWRKRLPDDLLKYNFSASLVQGFRWQETVTPHVLVSARDALFAQMIISSVRMHCSMATEILLYKSFEAYPEGIHFERDLTTEELCDASRCPNSNRKTIISVRLLWGDPSDEPIDMGGLLKYESLASVAQQIPGIYRKQS